MARQDPHSYADSAQPVTRSVDLKLEVDFATRRLDGTATLTLASPSAGPLDLDTRDLELRAVTDAGGTPIPFELSPPEPILGSRLRLALPPGTRALRIDYRTGPRASALQWLDPEQTAGKQHPYLFSQCQALHARSVAPLQDTPRLRLTYTAELTVPKALTALMAARALGRTEHGDTATFSFEMREPIPPYLLALAVGDLASVDLSARSRVWAEPSVVKDAAWEFAQVEEMIEKAEGIFGPYPWERFDLLVMPPSFPYGGMENPRLTFITPTVIAKDRSLVSVVAHELAHSWTGNLVTNASAEHFWINEGFTTYAERRIIEALCGREVAELQAAVGLHALEAALARFASKPELTRLETDLAGIDPDDAYSEVPYEKGYLFLRAIEEAAGRPRFDAFMRGYVESLRFQSVTTEELFVHLERALPGALERVNARAWAYGPGLPANAPVPKSPRLDALQRAATTRTLDGAQTWSVAEWQIFLETCPRPAPAQWMEAADRQFGLTQSRNYEVLVAWLTLGVASGYAPALARTQQVLGEVGRMKFLRPLYLALSRDPATRRVAGACYERYQARYHPIAAHRVKDFL